MDNILLLVDFFARFMVFKQEFIHFVVWFNLNNFIITLYKIV